MQRRRNRPRPTMISMTAQFIRAREGGYCARVVGGKGAYAQGETLREARANLVAVVLDFLELAPWQLPKAPTRGRVAGVSETLTFNVVR